MAEMEKCPNCGGTKNVDLGNGKHRCLYCGTSYIVAQPAPQPRPQLRPQPQPQFQPAPPPQQPPVVVVNQQNQNVNNHSCLDGCLKGTAGCVLYIIASVVGLILLVIVATCPH